MHRIVRQIFPHFKHSNFLGLSNTVTTKLKSHIVPFTPQLISKNQSIKWFLTLSVLQWLGFEKNDEEKEDELIMILKRSVLCTQREQYDKAEQMLHLALRLAQQQQNKQGIMYCYDLMANLAFDTYQLEKAQKIFVLLMQMLLEANVKEDDNKMIHISLKVARINHLLAKYDVAEVGYKWCMERINKVKDRDPDSKLLYGVVQDWYAQFLLDNGDVKGSIEHLKAAYEVCCEVQGHNSEQRMLLLNDLGITSWKAGDLQKAQYFLEQAFYLGKQLQDQKHWGVVHANLGLVYLQNGLVEQAKQFCKMGWNLGTNHENSESVGQSKYCLKQIKEFLLKSEEKQAKSS